MNWANSHVSCLLLYIEFENSERLVPMDTHMGEDNLKKSKNIVVRNNINVQNQFKKNKGGNVQILLDTCSDCH